MNAFSFANDILFEDPNMSLEALWRAGGAGAGTIVRVVRSEPDQETRWRDSRFVVGTVILDVRLSDVADLAAGDTFEIDAIVYEITGDPRRDNLQMTWRAEARVQ